MRALVRGRETREGYDEEELRWESAFERAKMEERERRAMAQLFASHKVGPHPHTPHTSPRTHPQQAYALSSPWTAVADCPATACPACLLACLD